MNWINNKIEIKIIIAIFRTSMYTNIYISFIELLCILCEHLYHYIYYEKRNKKELLYVTTICHRQYDECNKCDRLIISPLIPLFKTQLSPIHAYINLRAVSSTFFGNESCVYESISLCVYVCPNIRPTLI